MELVNYGYVEEELEKIELPSRPGCAIWGPKDLTGKQDRILHAKIDAMEDATDNSAFLELVLNFWIALPGTRWNLAEHEIRGDRESRLVSLPLNEETLLDRVNRTDRAVIALHATKLLFPALFAQQNEDDGDEDDELTDGLEMEDGSQAANPEVLEEGDRPNSGEGTSPKNGRNPSPRKNATAR